ncbi:type VI secretion system baseplate subunit TssF [Paracraurococcus lichenis]|uniref:Type VI secretion system baseplate subunit TssF n=1 Tax=Paracraurococcus lichenis TaxID=3064888 RepID=A0ABT9E9R4_9PROT|nr:type VI secretion system baseplate subunit TssF [Paracraurococcus sp. LOR1-02]MDO9712946.1 type VI secretion system baseplate subunit TssF [Paracraurococcus sp. LOR1-02]
MSDALLPYFRRELDALRRLAGEFAEAHPKIAGRLRLGADGADDPQVERLLEGVAFLAARVQHRLDDEFPELTDALLGLLYPHFLAPFPSCLVARLEPAEGLQAAARLPAGLAVDTEPVRGERCRFRTAYPVTLWPLEVESVRLQGLPLTAPANPAVQGRAAACLRIVLRCRGQDMTFARLGLDRLRLFLRGAPALPLYELLCAHALAVAYAEGPADTGAVILPPAAIAPVGFTPEEALLPWPARSFSGFRLLSEYFAFPQKFLFLDLCGMQARTRAGAGNRLEVFVWLDRSAPELERTLDAGAVALGCTPLVNLFPRHCEELPLDDTAIEARIVPEARRAGTFEVWSVERVWEQLSDGSARPWRPLYRMAHGDPDGGVPGGFYALARRAAGGADPGTEVWLAPHDPEARPEAARDTVLSIEALCLNRDLPKELPFGGGRPALSLVEGAPAVARLQALTPPTRTLRRPPRDGAWRLVSHLSLGHLSVVGGEAGAAALREVLRLYDLAEGTETRAAIAALLEVAATAGVARLPQEPRGPDDPRGRSGPAGPLGGSFCRGLDVTLTFDERGWESGGLYLLAAVLDRFLALHATVNAFTRTRVLLRGREDPVAEFPARAGARVLL